ncbi:putative transmembrane protein, partial [Chlamydia psittaci 06-1683]
GENY